MADPQLSPDGKHVVYGRRFVDAMNDRWETDLWIVGVDSSRNRFLADGSSARGSPSGDRIAFLAPGDPDGTQIFVRWMDAEGAVSQVTRVTSPPSNFAWSPDGKWIAFQMVAAGDDDRRWAIDMPKKPKGAEWTDSPSYKERTRSKTASDTSS